MSESKRYFLELSYKGTRFHGWQIQKNAYTVQECLENALTTYFSSPISVMGSGRTDTGVHASMQVCHFDTWVDFDKEKFLKAINAILPKDISIYSIKNVSQGHTQGFMHSKGLMSIELFFIKVLSMTNWLGIIILIPT